MIEVQELHVLCLVAFDTSYLKAAVIKVIVPGHFGGFSLGNFLFGFWLGDFMAQVF